MDGLLGSSSHRAVPSPNGQLLAAIVEDKEIQIIRTSLVCPQGRLLNRIKLQDRGFAARVTTIRWSPEQLPSPNLNADDSVPAVEVDDGGNNPRILLSDGRYIQIYDIWEIDSKRQLLLHLDFGDASGRISYIDFLIDSYHVIIFTEINIQATILTIDSRQYTHLKAPKFCDAKSFALHPKGKHVSLLTRTDGKDNLKIYQFGVSGYEMEVAVPLPTVDVQKMSWSPDGRFLAICDAASMGCKIYLFTADGQRLNNMDIMTFGTQSVAEDVEGLGVKLMVWLASSNILLVADFGGNIVLRRLNDSYQWDILEVLNHTDQIDDPSTFIWQEISETEQLAEQISRPFMLHAVSPHTTNGIPRSVEIIRDSHDGTLLATTSGLIPSTVWIWQGFRSPLTVLSFREPVRQILWHPETKDALAIITGSTNPRLHVWTKHGEPRSVSITLQKTDMTCGKIEVNCIPTSQGPRTDRLLRDGQDSYLFTLTNEKCFDIGIIEGTREHVKYQSVLNEEYFSDDD